MTTMDSTAPQGHIAQQDAERRTGLGWVLCSLALALPWLLPTHAEPWSMFYADALMAAAMLAAAAMAIWQVRRPWRFDVLVAGLLLAAVVPAVQAAAGLLAIPSEWVVPSLYLIAAAMTGLVARESGEAVGPRLIEALLTGLAIAALLSTGMALYQWLGLDNLGWLVAPMTAGRPVANVGQPNNLSTLLAWGLVAVWWAQRHGRIGGTVAVAAAAFLLLGVALTQSRTGWLAVALLAAVAVAARRVLGTRAQVGAWVGLLLWFVLLVALIEPLGQLLFREAALSLEQQLSGGKRPAIWMLALDAMGDRPWFGYGWNQTAQAHVLHATQYPLQTTIEYAHNIVLDLMLWNGIPLAAAFVGGLCWWTWHQLRGPLSVERVLLLAALGLLGVHAMLELPHAYALFLLPAALMMGTLHVDRPPATLLNVPQAAIALVVATLAAVLAVVFSDYRRIEEGLMSARLDAAGIGVKAPPPQPQPLVLRSLQQALEALRVEPRAGMSAQELAALRRTVMRHPSVSGLFRHAKAAALNGRPDEAAWSMGVLCSLHAARWCNAAWDRWEELVAEGQHDMATVRRPAAAAR